MNLTSVSYVWKKYCFEVIKLQELKAGKGLKGASGLNRVVRSCYQPFTTVLARKHPLIPYWIDLSVAAIGFHNKVAKENVKQLFKWKHLHRYFWLNMFLP